MRPRHQGPPPPEHPGDPAEAVVHPWSAWLAGVVARGLDGRGRHRDDLHNAALYGVWDAATRYDARGGQRWHNWAYRRALGAAQDELRRLEPRKQATGYVGRRKEAVRVVGTLAAHDDDGLPLEIAAAEDHVGWGLEYQDEVDALARRLPRACRPILRDHLARADCLKMRQAGARHGVSESWVSEVVTRAAAVLGRVRTPGRLVPYDEDALAAAVAAGGDWAAVAARYNAATGQSRTPRGVRDYAHRRGLRKPTRTAAPRPEAAPCST